MPEGGPGEEVADPSAERTRHCTFEVFADLAGGALGGFKRNVAGKAFGDDDVDGALADIVALDEPQIVEAGQFFFAKDTTGFAHLFEAFGFFDADVEETHTGTIKAEQNPRGGSSHDREIDEMLGIGADRGANVEHNR